MRERGFTLIELLVVMIIIAILMAVAVPTFLSHKRAAMATRAKQDIKLVINEIESCAALNTDGSINGVASGGGINCLDADVLKEREKTLAGMGAKFWSGDDAAVFPRAGEVAVADLTLGWGGATGYSVRASYPDANGNPFIGGIIFWEHRYPDGSIHRGCSPGGVGSCPATGKWG